MKKYIPYGRQCIEQDDIDAVVEVLKSDYLTTGPMVKEFEDTVAAYTGAKYAVAVSSGTAALHIACMAAGFGEGDEVITSPITFAASANCARYVGATPVFADIDSETYNISPDSIRERITEKTRGIIPVHLTGQPCDMERIHEIAREYNLTVIEDAAHALGASYKGRKIGALSDMTILSFHPVKHITTAEGGMVLTNDEELYRKLMLYRTHGITRDEDLLSHSGGGWYYEQLELGYNYRISDVQCALGKSQLAKLERFVARRREIAEKYDAAFAGIPEIITPKQSADGQSSWHLYVIQVDGVDRGKVFAALRDAGIGVNVHYIPLYRHPDYRNNGYADVVLPNAEQYYSRCISLPMYPMLTDEEQEYVIGQVIEAVQCD